MNPKQRERYFFEVSYRGSAYHGWQKQKNAHSVQAEIETACIKLWPGSGAITGSGRTDTGVHCAQQFFHLDIPVIRDPSRTSYRLNRMLPPDIAIGQIRRVVADAHARFSALSRSYKYCISRKKDVFNYGLSYHYNRELDVTLMNAAANQMKNFNDFQAFSKVRTDVNHFLCNIYEAGWEDDGSMITFHVRANRFLRGMVRAMVGTLMLVGQHKITVDQFTDIILSGKRSNAGASVPPEGLFLEKVEYPDNIYIDTI